MARHGEILEAIVRYCALEKNGTLTASGRRKHAYMKMRLLQDKIESIRMFRRELSSPGYDEATLETLDRELNGEIESLEAVIRRYDKSR
ncbi:MAG TPA: hypothetical protein VLM75_08665 [Spirochaetota bacterium]|nr:hypothetical protein [Spirochaetota bacterium]